ncbi:MAG TPA: histidine--tRNA ligase [Planctomycetota bacterium]|nr:histidine--tRNA ligase [Planctomycetota bacterium]
MKLRKPQGTEDVLPEQIGLWKFVEDTVKDVFGRYGYSEIRTPIMEFYSIFNRSAGETSDVVEKQMYLLQSRKEEPDDKDAIVLRPELTAPVVRAYLENNLDKIKKFQKFYYLGPLFRYERPQKGRLRQFHSVGVEALGSDHPLLDVEVIDLALRFFETLGIKDCRLSINSIGCPECRKTYTEALRNQLSKSTADLCEDCQRRFSKNILRILDCKNRKCYEIGSQIEPLEKHLCPGCQGHFEAVKKGLDDNKISYNLNNHLVRGFDYYTRTVFEITHSGLGAQDTLCGGGRYDNLIAEMGGPATPAVGFGIGLERVIDVLNSIVKKEIGQPAPAVYVVTTDQALGSQAFQMIKHLRGESIWADMDYEAKSVKAQFRSADKLKARFVVVLGPDELAKGMVKFKEMASGTEKEVKATEIVDEINKICSGVISGSKKQ